jgi:hypothetical protein
MSLRRFRFKSAEYDKVHAWIKGHGKAAVEEKEDEKHAEPLEQRGFTMPADYFPKIVWAHKVPLKLQKVAHGKEVIMVREGQIWKRLIHEQQIDGYLREVLLSSNSDVPMSRDAGHHIVQQRTVGISRRAFAKFISKQAVLQITRDALPKLKQPGRPLEGRGYLEIDLVEAKGHDIGKFVHHPVKSFYWITMIDRLTGWIEVKRSPRKDFVHIVPKLRSMLGKMSRVLKTEIKYIRSDSGSEFKSKTKAMFKELGIRHMFVKSGNRIEQANKTYQKIWYRLMRLGRGDLDELDVQAQAIFNNTLSSINGRTPLEALETEDAVLRTAFNDSRKKKVAKYKGEPIKKGDKCRYLLDSVRGKHTRELGYKSYRGKHWSAEVYTVVKLKKYEVHEGVYDEKYYVAKQWRTRDKLLLVPGVDALTRDAVTRKHRLKKQDWVDEIGEDLAL